MTNQQLILAITIPLLVVILIIFGVYIFGYIYNTLVKRRRFALNSWRELTKVLRKEFNYIPAVVKSVNMNKEMREQLASIYKEYKLLDLTSASPGRVSKLYALLTSCFEKLKEENGDNEVLEFIDESMRLSSFSIPLYNHNVRKYLRMRSKPINRSVAKTFGFEEIELFVVDKKEADTTIDLRLKNIK
ncbi:MAG: hypothetical protein WCR63_01705 [Bacilli bacterium]